MGHVVLQRKGLSPWRKEAYMYVCMVLQDHTLTPSVYNVPPVTDNVNSGHRETICQRMHPFMHSNNC